MRRCPRCEAANPDHAQWCGQCYAPFEGDEVEGPAPAGAGDALAPAGERGQPTALVRQRDGEVEWTCVTCGTSNPLAAGTCAACGTGLTAAFAAADPDPGRGAGADPRVALAATVVLPGSGHVLAGQAATGLARALLYVVWLGGGLVLAARGGALLVTGPLLLGALVLWAGSLADLLDRSGSQARILGARGLLWLVVAVTLLSLVGLLAGVGRLQGAAP